jgi:hypothetical protein
MQALFKLNMVCRLENLFQTLYAYFSESPKKHLEFNKLVEIMETQGNKLLKNVKIRWISMLELVKRVMREYCILMVKMALDFIKNIYVKVNFELLYGLAILLPLLMKMNDLMKLAQVLNAFAFLLCGSKKTLLGIFVIKFCGF